MLYSRDDKRYTEKKNKSERARRKKEDTARLRNIVDTALSVDPRIKRIKEEEKAAREAKKKAKTGSGAATPAAQNTKEEEEKKKAEEAAKKEEEEKVRCAILRCPWHRLNFPLVRRGLKLRKQRQQLRTRGRRLEELNVQGKSHRTFYLCPIVPTAMQYDRVSTAWVYTASSSCIRRTL
ncbi:hypothetical protein OE88DRAFT_1358842 [Heliocybe sulcata]|uniref:Zuotin-like zuotin homology domain-containing protein n=1 Tax=Heliocybe sulcata TaxID=5364 RepID=A0A5C3N6B8_9AGAM|nr:hypothetical protein OE88DRAFT_1358842 [Heliocybe sulcata]